MCFSYVFYTEIKGMLYKIHCFVFSWFVLFWGGDKFYIKTDLSLLGMYIAHIHVEIIISQGIQDIS